jgi:phage tail sheath gpL-like
LGRRPEPGPAPFCFSSTETFNHFSIFKELSMAVKYVLSVSCANDSEEPFVSGRKHLSAQKLINKLKAMMSGAGPKAYVWDVRATAVAASGTLTISSGSGTVGGSINGVSNTVTWATDDATTATALAAAINASSNALIQNLVTASASGGVVTITSTIPGAVGNCMTLTASGTGVTASGARLTGGSSTVLSYTF